MKSQFIINLDTSKKPLIQARDGALFLLCWGMWAAVLIPVANGTEWGNIKMSFINWYASQQVFFNALLADFHISSTYVILVGLLMCGVLFWSILGLLLAPPRRRTSSVPLTVEDMAHHFNLDSVLLSAMQKEKQVVVFHALTGAVTDVRCAYSKPDAYSDPDSQKLAA